MSDREMRRAIISTHTPLAGRDRGDAFQRRIGSHFYSHAPRGARQSVGADGVTWSCNFYSHAPRGARLQEIFRLLRGRRISTHTPLAGRDEAGTNSSNTKLSFLLTRPSRGATGAISQKTDAQSDFYSHAPRGARRISARLAACPSYFYSHAPRGARL